ncbi:hypothetical protein DPMN_161978 [Dreissena polymorpha]|uniref:Uncharacterized protein n=1 Tax=Dreissena polymorpha TaxID=45954 RepID=A0A9D4EQR4_DREPO|nr:hypothetical protein DPMN_161978 [Dreissena polymorpha]
MSLNFSGIPTTVYTDLSHPIVDHNHNELHTSAVHPYTAHREATYTDPEHPATATYPENGRAIYTDLDTTSHAYPEHRGATYTDQEHPATAHAYPAHKGPTYTDQDGNCYQEDGTPFECPPDYPGAQYAPRYQSLQSGMLFVLSFAYMCQRIFFRMVKIKGLHQLETTGAKTHDIVNIRIMTCSGWK